MSVSAAEVQRIAHLSKLNLDGSELEKLTEDFNQILGFVAQIREVNVEGVPAFEHALGLENVRREDDTAAELTHEDIRSIAPRFEAGYIVVPQVIETDE